MAIAYPFVEVRLDDKGLVPIATRAPGVVAIVGVSNAGAVAAGVPMAVDDVAAATSAFGAGTPLFKSLRAALLQNPSPYRFISREYTSSSMCRSMASLRRLC